MLITTPDTLLVVSQYHFDISWIHEYTDNYIIYDKGHTEDRSDPRVKYLDNTGHNIGTILHHIIENYDNLNETTIFAKGDLIPRHCKKDKFDRVCNNKTLTSLESYEDNPENNAHIKAPDGGYMEINNSWYMNHHVHRHFKTYNEFMSLMFKSPIVTRFTRFAPGANYIVPKINLLKYSCNFYKRLLSFCDYMGTPEECGTLESIPGECHVIERALHTIWTCDYEPTI